MKLKKLLVMSMVALSILMVGCQNDKNSSDKASTSSQSVSESIDINTYHETIPVPEEGWTAETLNKTIYINGKNVSFPFTIQDLGEGFEWDYDDFSVFKTGEPSVVLMKYNEIDFALVSVYASNEEELNDGKIMGLSSMENTTNPCYINGVTVGSTDKQIINELGEPSEYNPEKYEMISFMKYQFNNFYINFIIKDECVSKISIIMEDE